MTRLGDEGFWFGWNPPVVDRWWTESDCRWRGNVQRFLVNDIATHRNHSWESGLPQVVSAENLWKDKAVKRLSLITALVALFLLPGCVSVKSTAVFYTPSTNVVYPPKPKDAVIPVMNQPPSRSYAEIGRFSFQSDLGYPFMMRAIQYNARRVGADAVLIKDSRSWTIPYLYSVPPTLGWIPVGGWYGGGCGGWYGGAAAVPVWYPGYSGVSYDTFTGIDARMIIFR